MMVLIGLSDILSSHSGAIARECKEEKATEFIQLRQSQSGAQNRCQRPRTIQFFCRSFVAAVLA